jgi:hypothetical protein
LLCPPADEVVILAVVICFKVCVWSSDCYTKNGWNPKKKDIDDTFNRYYQSGMEPDHGDPGYPLWVEFNRRCRENNAMSYGQLLVT